MLYDELLGNLLFDPSPRSLHDLHFRCIGVCTVRKASFFWSDRARKNVRGRDRQTSRDEGEAEK